MASSSNHNSLPVEALPFMCSVCSKRYAQRQGLNRHYGEKHDPNLCMYSYCNFGWTRPCKYRAHLRTHHPNVNPDEVLGKTAESRCRTAAFARRQLQHDSEPRRRRLTPIPPAVAEVMNLPHSFSVTEEGTQPVNNVVNHAPRLPPAYPRGPTAADFPSHMVTAFIPSLPTRVGEYYGTSVFIDPIVGLSGLMRPYPFSADSYDGI